VVVEQHQLADAAGLAERLVDVQQQVELAVLQVAQGLAAARLE
jgi:hypothetical protein